MQICFPALIVIEKEFREMLNKNREKKDRNWRGQRCTLKQVLTMRESGIPIQIYAIATQQNPRAAKVHSMRDICPQYSKAFKHGHVNYSSQYKLSVEIIIRMKN